MSTTIISWVGDRGDRTGRAEQTIAAAPERVREVITDYPGRARWLRSEYSDVRVEPDGTFAYRLSVGGRQRHYRMRPDVAGAAAVEHDTGSSLTTTWSVGGFFERTFAPRPLGGLHRRRLERVAEECR